MSEPVNPDVLQEKINNINQNLTEFKSQTSDSFKRIEKMILDWKSDFSTQFKSLETRVNTLYDYQETSKDDRRDLHRITDALALENKNQDKDIIDIKSTLKVMQDGRIETGGFWKGLNGFAKGLQTIASIILSLGVILTFVIGGLLLFIQLHK